MEVLAIKFPQCQRTILCTAPFLRLDGRLFGGNPFVSHELIFHSRILGLRTKRLYLLDRPAWCAALRWKVMHPKYPDSPKSLQEVDFSSASDMVHHPCILTTFVPVISKTPLSNHISITKSIIEPFVQRCFTRSKSSRLLATRTGL